MRQCAGMSDLDLPALLSTLDPSALDDFRRVLMDDRADRDVIASQLLRYRDERATIGPTSSTCRRCIRRSDARSSDF
jgi:hypothetical protein